MSELDLDDTYGDLIEINNKSSGEFRTVQVKRNLNHELAFPIVVELDCKYVVSNGPSNKCTAHCANEIGLTQDFLRHVVAVAAAEKP